MPRFGFDDEGVSMMTRGPGPLTLKRSRPTMEPAKVPASPCMLKCCAEVKDHETSCLMCASSRATVAYDMSIDTSFPEDEFLDEDFDLGPPPPSGPVLVRQNAMDMTASAEAKYAAMARKMNDVKPASAMPMAVPVLPPPRGAPGMMMVPPMFVRHSRSTN